ncbi:MAG TPA: PAS domain-containing protein, partial [Burkholderiaceae bacterium]|nr:PAS domain-containing protein [Burkholderiaceae bacterium]
MTDQSEPTPTQSAFAPSAVSASAHKVSAWLLSSFHSAMDGMVVADATRQIVLLNREMERMFGYPAKRLVGQPLDVLFSILSHADYSPQIRDCLARGEAEPEARIKLELQGIRANGEEFPLDASISALTTEGEHFLAFVLREKTADLAVGEAAPAHALLQSLSASTHQANEVERRRFSRELYDDLGQNLSVLKLDLDWLQNGGTDTGPQFHARVAHMQTVLDSIIVHTKSIASALRPPLLDDFGLVAALKWASERFQKKTGIRCSLQ